MKLYSITHKCLATDTITIGSSLVEASSSDIARRKFNKVAAKRRHYPYMWSDAMSVEEAIIIK